MPFEDNKILEFNQYQKSDAAPFIIYADLECVVKKMMDAKIFHQVLQCLQYLHLEAQKISMMYTEVKIAFCEFLRERTMKKINCKKKKMKLLTKEHQKSSENAKICYICKEKSKINI